MKRKVVTDEEIQTALKVLDALRDEFRCDARRRLKHVPNDVTWSERTMWIEFDLRANLCSTFWLKRKLKQWMNRRINRRNIKDVPKYALTDNQPIASRN